MKSWLFKNGILKKGYIIIATKKNWVGNVIPYMGVSKSCTPKSSILIGLSIIFTIHFGVFPPIFGNVIPYIFGYFHKRSASPTIKSPQKQPGATSAFFQDAQMWAKPNLGGYL